jgi:phosphate:Na+ symporter
MDVGKYSPIALVAGLAMMMLSRSNTISKSGKVLLFFGMMFFGLYTMERAVEPLKGLENFDSWMRGLEHPLTGALTGALVTLIIQSSSATVGMAITLAKKEAITLAAGVAVMLGAELGTCSDTLLATINGSRAAIRTGVFHLFFNFTSIVIGLLLFGPFIQLVEYVSKDAHLERKIANAHVLFNVCGVLLFVGFVPLIEPLLNRIIPDKAKS